MASACVHCYASVTDLDETDSVPTTKICTCEKSNGIQKISKGTETCRHKLQRWRLNTSSTRLVIFPQSRPYKPLGVQPDVGVGIGVANAAEGDGDFVCKRKCRWKHAVVDWVSHRWVWHLSKKLATVLTGGGKSYFNNSCKSAFCPRINFRAW